MKATAKDLRFFSKELIESALRGEQVIITYRGKPVVKLVPIKNKRKKSIKKRRLFGIWKDRTDLKNVNDYVRNLRKGRTGDID